MAIICSCNLLTDCMVKEYMKSNGGEKPSVEMIFKAFDKNTVCATCVKNVKSEIRKHLEDTCLGAEKGTLEEDSPPV